VAAPPVARRSAAGPGELYEITDAEPELEVSQVELRTWETMYDTIRPHQALAYLTPSEYLASVGIDVYRTY
jgi:transposase InsO family protein